MANFKFEFVVSDMAAWQVAWLMEVIITQVEVSGGTVGGGYAQADDEGLLPGEADEQADAPASVGAS